MTAYPKPTEALDTAYLDDLRHYLLPLRDAVVDWEADAMPSDAVIVWDASEADGAPRGVRTIVADPLLTPGARDAVCRWVSGRAVADEDVVAAWEASLRTLKRLLGERGLALVGGGAIGATRTDVIAYAYLGSAVLDKERTAKFPPSLVLAADSVGQFGTGRAARAFQRRLREALAEGAHLVVPQHLGPLVTMLFRDHAESVHVVPIGTERDRLWTTGRTRERGNVLTTLGLPLAAALGTGCELLGVTREPGASGQHWDVKADALAALENMIAEPASVAAAACETYRVEHFRTLADGLAEMEAPDAQTAPGFRHHLARLVSVVDGVQALAWPVAFVLSVVTLAALVANAVGVLSASTFAVAISLVAVFAVPVVGLLLRQRLNRWQLKFERERRAMERRERRLVLERLEELEERLSARAD